MLQIRKRAIDSLSWRYWGQLKKKKAQIHRSWVYCPDSWLCCWQRGYLGWQNTGKFDPSWDSKRTCVLELPLSCCSLEPWGCCGKTPWISDRRVGHHAEQRWAVPALVFLDQRASPPSDVWVSHPRLFSASQADVGQKVCLAAPQNHKKIKMLVISNIWGNSICKQKLLNSNIKIKTFAFR